MKEKFECYDCGVYYWVIDRDNFDCPNCEEQNN
jgi:Zn finger protein HypA/HybF involved in hydrogenase expression